jgi:hypothetical protein
MKPFREWARQALILLGLLLVLYLLLKHPPAPPFLPPLPSPTQD